MNVTKRFVSINEARKLSGFSRPYFTERVKRGEIPFTKVGRKVLIDLPAFYAQIEREMKDKTGA